MNDNTTQLRQRQTQHNKKTNNDNKDDNNMTNNNKEKKQSVILQYMPYPPWHSIICVIFIMICSVMLLPTLDK